MFDLTGIVVILIFILLIILALAVALKLLGTGEGQIAAQQVSGAPVPMDEGKFLIAFLKPIYEDGLEEMETAVGSIRDGGDLYRRDAYVEAAEEFIAGRRSVEAAARKFREVMSLVEDPEEGYVQKARARLAECKRFLELAKEMESACDAMLADRPAEARAIVDRTGHLRKLAEEWEKD